MPSNLSRRIAALRALADRPGTPAEGVVAQKKLEEALAKDSTSQSATSAIGYEKFVFPSNPVTDSIVAEALRSKFWELYQQHAASMKFDRNQKDPPHAEQSTYCPCGTILLSGICDRSVVFHSKLRWDAKRIFPEGSMANYSNSSRGITMCRIAVHRYLEPWNLVEIEFFNGRIQTVELFENGKCCFHSPGPSPRWNG